MKVFKLPLEEKYNPAEPNIHFKVFYAQKLRVLLK